MLMMPSLAEEKTATYLQVPYDLSVVRQRFARVIDDPHIYQTMRPEQTGRAGSE